MEKERKQGFFAALKEEVVRGLLPATSRGKSSAPPRSASLARMLIPRRHKALAAPPPPPPPEKVLQQYLGEQLVARYGSLHPGGEALAPLIEGPDAERLTAGDPDAEDPGRREGFRHRVCGHLTCTPSMASSAACGRGGPGGSTGSFRRSDLRLLVGVIPSKPAEPLPIASTTAGLTHVKPSTRTRPDQPNYLQLPTTDPCKP
jgi:hypothetical protein